MECPRCGSVRDKVIDSRLTKDRVSIRRRRQCSICSKRFTTYEATEEQMLSVLLQRKVGHRVTKNNLRAMLSFISHTLSELSFETKRLAVKVDKLSKAQVVAASHSRAAAKAGSRRKISPPKTAGHQSAGSTSLDTVLKTIRRYKKGVDIATLKTKTGFSDRQIRNIVYRATRQGKIRRIKRATYILEPDDRET